MPSQTTDATTSTSKADITYRRSIVGSAMVPAEDGCDFLKLSCVHNLIATLEEQPARFPSELKALSFEVRWPHQICDLSNA